MKVTDVARATGTSPHAVRYYVRLGLIQPSRREANGYREFHASNLARIAFIRTGNRGRSQSHLRLHCVLPSSSRGAAYPPFVELVERLLQKGHMGNRVIPA
ncbi:MAG: MerR family DNA-binding transcriptional regulator [Burkholderiales bacterium]